ncbi:MAG: transcriptional regulator, partial [Verrucomicrobiales bacterium VVV1]
KLAQSFLNDPVGAVGDAKKSSSTPAASRETATHIRAIENRLRELFATHVSIQHSAKKGKIELEYYGNDDLQRILELLGADEA